MTNATYETFIDHLGQVQAGRRGLVAFLSYATGREAKLLRETARVLGFDVKPQGKYGYCAFRPRA